MINMYIDGINQNRPSNIFSKMFIPHKLFNDTMLHHVLKSHSNTDHKIIAFIWAGVKIKHVPVITF